ncbi:autophagy protein Apg5-domain-containing protein [Thamnocephalis sphaerospora]|uniref:Autophagy protein 5 n=1 Tax=Thamnocephalis sphaerospora TaxID=78915 RepID=A0A4P9XGN2_9FUNG|nr:autophagy protein Apg5-domain-containing protein [Thamnocephalis sphaerospora]|eukprot:RKP04805.1 autophagy protein Apg5-domain-containing protein [Thamnocephalis sphaerospora]
MTTVAEQLPVTHAIWLGEIPVQFVLDAGELEAAGVLDTRTEPCFMLARRCSYLPLLTPLVIELLVQRNLPFIGDESDIWYTFEEIPLRWHYPIGLLYDMLVPHDSQLSTPWQITVHTRGYPGDRLLKSPPPGLETMHDLFMGLIKEASQHQWQSNGPWLTCAVLQADFLRNGSSKGVMRLSKQDQTQLWDALSSGDFDDFWSVNSRLVAPAPAARRTNSYTDKAPEAAAEDDTVDSPSIARENSDGSSHETTLPKHIPMRLYLPDCPVIQEPVAAVDEHGQERTLGDALHQLLPLLFPTTDAGEAEDVRASPILHGVTAPLDMPLGWAAQCMVHADNFLHIVIDVSSM